MVQWSAEGPRGNRQRFGASAKFDRGQRFADLNLEQPAGGLAQFSQWNADHPASRKGIMVLVAVREQAGW